LRYQETSVYLYTVESENAIGAFMATLIGVNPLIVRRTNSCIPILRRMMRRKKGQHGGETSVGKGERIAT